MEAQRDLTQIVVHVDMDAFYAGVEVLDNPDLEGKPFAVRYKRVSLPSQLTLIDQVGHGVVCTASYGARKFGVRSGMPGAYLRRRLVTLCLNSARVHCAQTMPRINCRAIALSAVHGTVRSNHGYIQEIRP